MNKKTRNILIIVASIVAFLLLAAAKICMLVKKLKKGSDFFFYRKKKDFDYSGEEFEDTSIACLLSVVTVDLKDSRASKDPMNLTLKAKSSDINVIVPDNWNVKLQGNDYKSDIDNSTSFVHDDFESPIIFIQYDLKSSRLSVKYLSDLEEDIVETESE